MYLANWARKAMFFECISHIHNRNFLKVPKRFNSSLFTELRYHLVLELWRSDGVRNLISTVSQ